MRHSTGEPHRAVRHWEAVLLAAGASSRMGSHKALLSWSGTALVVHQIRELLAGRTRRVVVVLGAEAERIRETILAWVRSERVALVVNPDWRTGKCSSIRAGVGALSEAATDVAVLSVDQPTKAEVVDALMGYHERGEKDATLPSLEGRRGHPVLVRADRRDALMTLREERQGLRGLIEDLEKAGRLLAVEMAAPSVRWNLNSPEDVERLSRRAR